PVRLQQFFRFSQAPATIATWPIPRSRCTSQTRVASPRAHPGKPAKRKTNTPTGFHKVRPSELPLANPLRETSNRQMMQRMQSIAAASSTFVVLAVVSPFLRADDQPMKSESRNPGLERLSPEVARMYDCVKRPRPGELKWQEIPWLTSLGEAID